MATKIEEGCNCLIEQLLETPFDTLSFEEKKVMLAKGRPTPDLPNLTQTRLVSGKPTLLKFNVSKYDLIPWLCGCAKLSKLYCWPCLLLNQTRNKWNRDGVIDLNNLGNTSKQRHSEALEHIAASIRLKELLRMKSDGKIDYTFDKNKHNFETHKLKVKSNRYVVRKLIDSTIFLAQQGMTRCPEQPKNSSNNCRELLNLQAKGDARLREHLEKCTVFSQDDPTVYDDLIESCSIYLMQRIKQEVSEAKFVSLISDIIIDAANQPILSNVLRYVDGEGEVQERLARLDVCDIRTKNSMSQCISDLMDVFKCEDKLVAQAYDGAAVNTGDYGGLINKVKSKCPQAMFTNCYSQKLTLVLQSCTKHITLCEDFFKTLSGMSSFFCNLPKRSYRLNKIVNSYFPSIAPDKWIRQSQLVQTVFSQKDTLKRFFKSATTDEVTLDAETRFCVDGFIEKLGDFKFNFVLEIFHLILPRARALSKTLNTKTVDTCVSIKEIDKFKACLHKTRENWDKLRSTLKGNEFESEVPIKSESEVIENEAIEGGPNQVWIKPEPVDFETEVKTEAETETETEAVTKVPRKRRRTDDEDLTEYRQIYYEIVDALILHTEERFADLRYLEFFSLVNSSKFQEYSEKFPLRTLRSMTRSPYGRHFKEGALHTELNYIYTAPAFQKHSIKELQDFLTGMGCEDTLPELTKLLLICQTIPISNPSANPNQEDSVFKRIRTHVRSTNSQDRLHGLSLLFIEKRLLKDLQNSVSFYDDIIDIFATMKERHFELEYKS